MANENMRENDLVLSPNEFAFVSDTTKGNISSAVGPYKTSLSTSDRMVVFNEDRKMFEEVDRIEDAIQKFVTAPENFYIQIKNPAKDGKHPTVSTSNSLPDLDIGRKINIVGPCSFALYPGQMAKVIPGHRMHSNQYLKARVYDAEAANATRANLPPEVVEPSKLSQEEENGKLSNISLSESNQDEETEAKRPIQEDYVVGQILIIKGTDVPFYIPPTGIEVLPIGGYGNDYVRDALTLRKLEYCILEDEAGKRSYIHGPAVVFPRPDQKFVKNTKEGGITYSAIELSKISGIYVKVIDDYKDLDGTEHKIGEELFITGEDTPIYFPREEHNIIDYDGQIVYHAVAIPEGEGRYVLNRKTGVVKTVRGPEMLLINPIDEVFLQRFLTEDQCKLWYPGNGEVLRHNLGDEDGNKMGIMADYSCSQLTKSYSAPVGFSRSTTFTPPRTIRLDNSKFEGAVSISVRTGYAVNLISKSGKREVVVGPKTILLDFDQTLEVLELSTGKPKTTDYLLREVYLRVENNKISDIIHVETSDFVKADVKVSYTVNFLKEHKEKWFSIENYVKFLCDRERSILKAIVKQYTVEEFYSESSNIVRSALLGAWNVEGEEGEAVDVSLVFEENGMEIADVDVLSVKLEQDIARIVDDAQEDIVRGSIELTTKSKALAVKKELAKITQETLQIDKDLELADLEKRKAIDTAIHDTNVVLATAKAKADKARQDAELEVAVRERDITATNLENNELRDQYNLDLERQKYELRKNERDSQTGQVERILDKITPRLVAAMESNSNARIIESIAENISPYALARHEDAMEVMNSILRGSPLEDSLKAILQRTTES